MKDRPKGQAFDAGTSVEPTKRRFTQPAWVYLRVGARASDQGFYRNLGSFGDTGLRSRVRRFESCRGHRVALTWGFAIRVVKNSWRTSYCKRSLAWLRFHRVRRQRGAISALVVGQADIAGHSPHANRIALRSRLGRMGVASIQDESARVAPTARRRSSLQPLERSQSKSRFRRQTSRTSPLSPLALSARTNESRR